MPSAASPSNTASATSAATRFAPTPPPPTTPPQLQTQGNYLEALECMERGLVLRQHFFGADSDEVWRACKVVGEMCNLLAMTYLQQEDFAMVLELLKKAEILTERDNAGRAVTFNNLACYYRRQGKLHAALQYLQKVRRWRPGVTWWHGCDKPAAAAPPRLASPRHLSHPSYTLPRRPRPTHPRL